MINLGLSGISAPARRDMPRSRAARSTFSKSGGNRLRRCPGVSSTSVCRLTIRDSMRWPAMAHAFRSITGSTAKETRRSCPSAVFMGQDVRLVRGEARTAAVAGGVNVAFARLASALISPSSAAVKALASTWFSVNSVTSAICRSSGWASPRM